MPWRAVWELRKYKNGDYTGGLQSLHEGNPARLIVVRTVDWLLWNEWLPIGPHKTKITPGDNYEEADTNVDKWFVLIVQHIGDT